MSVFLLNVNQQGMVVIVKAMAVLKAELEGFRAFLHLVFVDFSCNTKPKVKETDFTVTKLIFFV